MAEPAHSVQRYDDIVHRYDRCHTRWLRHAGGEAQAAFEGAVRAIVWPGMSVLDAGCGTGALARALIGEGLEASQITLLDPSPRMLERCGDMPVARVLGGLESLPFEDCRFDIVTCAWALETAPCVRSALAEMSRVIRPGGTLCIVFCADLPDGSLASWAMRRSVMLSGLGRFLDPDRIADAISSRGDFVVRRLPCRGPAAAFFARRAGDFPAPVQYRQR